MNYESYTDIKTVTVIGAGGMGEGITLNFAQSGLTVRVVTRSNSTMTKCLTLIDESLKVFDEFGLLDEKPSVIRSRIQPFLMSDLQTSIKDADFIIESVPEVLETKKEIFAQLETSDPHVILSSNTSSFPISALTEGMRTPERFIGTHYFMPAHIIPLVEVHWGEKTRQEVIEATVELMNKAGKKPILVRKAIPGFVVNRIQAAIAREAHYLLEQGVVSVQDFDTAAKSSYGFRLANLGPLEQSDINGLDTVYRGNSRIYKELNNATEPAHIFTEKVEKGELGLKTGKGFYDYSSKPANQVMRKIEINFLKQLQLFREREGS